MKVQKPGEQSDGDKAILKQELRAGCRNMGTDTIYSVPGNRVPIHSKTSFGLCADCGHFAFTATQFKIKIAACEQHEHVMVPLSENEPVVECSSYYMKNEQDAHDYSKNAWILDPADKKVGLI